MNTTDALSLGILAINTLAEPDATDADGLDFLDLHGADAVETLATMRDEQRDRDMSTSFRRAIEATLTGDGDALVVMPYGTDIPGAQHDDFVTAIAAIDLVRFAVDQYDERANAEDASGSEWTPFLRVVGA